MLGLGHHHSHLFWSGDRGAHPVWAPTSHLVVGQQPDD
jgi:hypothetical protein